MDNVRTVIIFLMVLYHVGGVYADGLWASLWIVDDPDTITWVGIIGIVFDVFIMGTLFIISGYLAPAVLKNRSGWAFVKEKAKRLLIPWVISVFTLIPLYNVIFLYSRGLPQEHWLTYFHFANPRSQSWLWFLPVALVFNLVYLWGGHPLPVRAKAARHYCLPDPGQSWRHPGPVHRAEELSDRLHLHRRYPG